MRHSASLLFLCLAAMSCKGKPVGAPREVAIGGRRATAGAGFAGTTTYPGIVGGRPNSGAAGQASTAGQQQAPDAGRDSGSGGTSALVAQGGAAGLPDGIGGSSGDGGTSDGGTTSIGAGGDVIPVGAAGASAGARARSCTLGDFALNECSLR